MLLATQFSQKHIDTNNITELDMFTVYQSVDASVTSNMQHKSHQDTTDQCIDTFCALAKKIINTRLNWVPRHAGVAANELVDGCAYEVVVEAI